jgi:putative ABC transport system ATP-binding protein
MIEIKNLHVNFTHTNSANAALSLAHWQVAAGAHTLVLGPSGSGKSTLLNILGGLAAKINDGASISVCGVMPYQISRSARDALRAQHIGFVTQRVHLINAISVAENLRLALRLGGNALQKTAENTRISAILAHLNLSHKALVKPTMLSVGEAQRVAIARAVIKRPALLIADEPTSSLDDANALSAAQLLIDTANQHGSTLIVATHDARIKHLFAHTLNIGAAS